MITGGWAIGVCTTGAAIAVHNFQLEGWFEAFRVTSDGQEIESVGVLVPDEVKDAVRMLSGELAQTLWLERSPRA